jgi:phosphatidylethanolamine/phosphatidyl-N-methylethanolamine N-methyltransferase
VQEKDDIPKSKSAIRRQYDRLCYVYDMLFSHLLNPGRRAVARKINGFYGSRLLEVGVGSGLSLPFYRPGLQVTGVDISPRMLERAAMRVKRHGLQHVTLMQMDGEKLDFPAHTFDVVVALYVVSTTSSPGKMMRELERVCTPGGKIFILNHFSKNGAMRTVEKWVKPVADRIGWNSCFTRSRIFSPSLRLTSITSANAFGYWELLEFETPRS